MFTHTPSLLPSNPPTCILRSSAFLSISNQAATLLGITKCGKPDANGLNGYACNFAQAMQNIHTRQSAIYWQPCIASLIALAFL